MLKILVVFSWDDDISEKRYRRIRRVLRGAPFLFEQCFATPSPEANTDAETIIARVSRAIETYHPDVLLIHTGAAYDRGPEEYVKAVSQIHEKYPRIRLGLERCFAEQQLVQLGLFEESSEMHSIEQAIFI
ncbi:MAG: hypothetical protein FD174_313 [Geobacteraceae bacterium]|nr:MAG: hypothetical protein FD174_313 [Geobacteraceae bacterium]